MVKLSRAVAEKARKEQAEEERARTKRTCEDSNLASAEVLWSSGSSHEHARVRSGTDKEVEHARADENPLHTVRARATFINRAGTENRAEKEREKKERRRRRRRRRRP